MLPPQNASQRQTERFEKSSREAKKKEPSRAAESVKENEMTERAKCVVFVVLSRCVEAHSETCHLAVCVFVEDERIAGFVRVQLSSAATEGFSIS